MNLKSWRTNLSFTWVSSEKPQTNSISGSLSFQKFSSEFANLAILLTVWLFHWIKKFSIKPLCGRLRHFRCNELKNKKIYLTPHVPLFLKLSRSVSGNWADIEYLMNSQTWPWHHTETHATQREENLFFCSDATTEIYRSIDPAKVWR